MGLFSKINNFFFSSINFYSRILTSAITKGFNDIPDKPLSDDEFYYSINRIYTNKKVKKIYFVNEFPRLVDEGFINDLKKTIEDKVDQINKTYKTNKNCELVAIVKSEPYELDFSTLRNRSRILMWKNRYEKAMEEHGDITAIDALVAKEDVLDSVDRNQWMMESWMFVKKAKDGDKSAFCKTNVIFELVSDSDDLLLECEKVFKDYMFGNDIKYNEIFLQSNEYNKVFSAAGNEERNLLAKMNYPNVLNDIVVSSFDKPTHGHAGEEKGIYFGNNIHTGLPLMYDLKKGSDAINFLVTANTGKGKSNYMKGTYSYLDLNDIRTITLDYEGDEYDPVGVLYDATFIKVSGDQSRYFNTIAIGDLTGDPKIDNGLKKEAIDITKMVFSLLLDEEKGMTSHELSIFSDCVNRVYDRFGVTDDKKTWHKSKKITYFHLYGELVEMAKLDYYVREYNQHIKDMIIKLRTYFEHDGINRSMFDNPINIEELLGSKHIIFTFGMKGVDESLIDTKELALKQLFVGYITTLVSNYNRSEGRLTAVLIEEMQRYLMHPHSGSVVANMVSGGRKRGMIMYLITNAPLQLIQAADIDNELKQYISAIVNNINGYVIGKLKDIESEILAEYFSLERELPYLRLINKEGSMKYSFLVNFRDESSVVKYLFHPDLLETELYKTRKDQSEIIEEGRKLRGNRIKETVGEIELDEAN